VSDENDVADDSASDGGETEESRPSGGRTAVVTKSVVRPQRPSGKRSRQRPTEDVDDEDSTAEVKADADDKTGKKGPKGKSAKRDAKSKKATKPAKAGRSANPFVFVYNYLKQVVAEMRKVIWPSRKQMVTYTSVVLVFLAFMVALVGLTDFGLTKLVLLVFG